MKLYGFDGIDAALELLPLAARRSLDLAGLRLSREGWRSLPLEARRRVVEIGAGDAPEAAEVRQLVSSAIPPAEAEAVRPEPDATAVPPPVTSVLGAARPVPAATWAALSPLDRYAIDKVCASGRGERIDAAYAEIVGHGAVSSHLAPSGGAHMVPVGSKPVTARRAVAESVVQLGADAFGRLARHEVPKGDVLGTARLAGILAAKRTSELVPLCHHVSLTHVSVEFELVERDHLVRILARAEASDRTGVEMESLVAATLAALTIYDMLKGVDRGITIGPTRLLEKAGGRTGSYER